MEMLFLSSIAPSESSNSKCCHQMTRSHQKASQNHEQHTPNRPGNDRLRQQGLKLHQLFIALVEFGTGRFWTRSLLHHLLVLVQLLQILAELLYNCYALFNSNAWHNCYACYAHNCMWRTAKQAAMICDASTLLKGTLAWAAITQRRQYTHHWNLQSVMHKTAMTKKAHVELTQTWQFSECLKRIDSTQLQRHWAPLRLFPSGLARNARHPQERTPASVGLVDPHNYWTDWWFQPSEKYVSIGILIPNKWKKNVPNHQPEKVCNFTISKDHCES